jgi:hypothetical protein
MSIDNYVHRPDNEPQMEDYGDGDDAYEAALGYMRDVADELHKLKVRQAARDALRAESEPPAPPFDAGTLGEVLARPADPPMRVDGMIPWEASTLFVAQRKTGKTTLILNLVRSLLTGEDFLGSYPVRPVEGTIAVLNFEVSAAMLARWADDVGIDLERLYLVNLRGRRNPLSHAQDRARLAADLRGRGVETLIVDPFGRAYTGASQNDSGEVGSFLVDLDLFARFEVGAKDLILTAHAGWNGERTRGSSALEDWADSIVTLTRDAEDESLRYLRATGRDVEIDEDRLDFNQSTRTLTMSGTGSRKKGKADRKVTDLAVFAVRAAHEHSGIGVAEMEAAIREMDDAPTFRNGEVSKAAKCAAEQGHMRIVPGESGKKSQHFAIDKTTSDTKTHTPPNPSQTHPGDDSTTPPTPSYRGGVGVGGTTQPQEVGGVPGPDTEICGICQTRAAAPHRGICATCDTDRASTLRAVKAAS